MKYDIYFHNDFDGVASAALMKEFLEKRGEGIKNYFLVDYVKISNKSWARKKFRNPVVIVDFLYHPQAAFYFDHHQTTFLKKEWQKKFRRDRCHRFGKNYYSNYHLVVDSLEKDFNFRPSRYFRELIKWADIIDGARYDSAEQAVKLKEPALQMRDFIRHNMYKNSVLINLIKILGKQSLRQITNRSEIKSFVRNRNKNTISALKFYRKNLQIFSRIGFLDLSKEGVIFLRYVPYFLYPQLFYCLILLKQKRKFGLMVGFNPWQKIKNKIDIGEFLRRRYGGGGRTTVGGIANIRNKKRAQRIVEEIVGFLNKNG